MEVTANWPAAALEGWRDFYLLVGTAGATLLALLFVAVTLGAGYLTESRQSGTRTYMSPVVVHFASVFFLSAVALAPAHPALFYAVIIGVAALTGLIVSVYTTVQVLRSDISRYWPDYFAYGFWPVVAYLALAAAAGLIGDRIRLGLDLLPGALLLLTLVNIRNAWDLTLSMARHARGEK